MSKQCAVVGAGVIGGGWAARFVLNGLNVAVFDPQPSAERAVREMLENAERAHAKLGLDARQRRGELRFAASLAEAVDGADLVQESALEREDLKRALLRDIDAHAPADALVCSSTSGLLPTQLQAEMARPERFVVGHPFNPVYLLPLVELCAGTRTAPETVARAAAFYAALGMEPLHVRKEIDGFIADRLLEALWREALWLVHDDVATVAEIDDAIRFGAGLRWSFMGTFLTYRLAGGEDGMRHFMAQFGPALKLPWTKLMEVPELTEAFIDKIALQSDAQAGGARLRALERKRDDCLVAVLQALKSEDYAAGALIAARARQRFAEAGEGGAAPVDAAAPLRWPASAVRPDWVDYNNHMTDHRYLQIFGEATDSLLRLLGVDGAYLQSGFSYYTVESHIVHRREIAGLAPYSATTQILAADEKRIHVFHRLHHGATDELLASGEQMLLHVDTKAGRACPAPSEILGHLFALRDAHVALPRPEGAGRAVAMKPGASGEHGAEIARFLDPEVAAFVARTESFYPASVNTASAAENRAVYDRMCAAFRQKRPAGVAVVDEQLAADAPRRSLALRRYMVATQQKGVALLYLHGGGFVVGGLESHDDVCAELCLDTAIEVVSLDYRLAPEHPYPAALDDTEAAYRRLVAEGRRVILGGDSAGGQLAAALCLRLKRIGEAPPLGQVLIYPGLGGDPMRIAATRRDVPLLRVADSLHYRRVYAGGGEDRIPRDDPEFAPLSANDLAGLPPAAIFAAGIDPLRQDAEDYAALLAAAGVPVQFRCEPGLVHGYLRARYMSSAAARSFAEIADSVRQLAAASAAQPADVSSEYRSVRWLSPQGRASRASTT